MQNLLWYIYLALGSLVITAIIIYKKRSSYNPSTLCIFYLAAAGSAWVGEFFVLGLFNAYVYNTGLFSDPWAQNLLGHLLLNTTLYPTITIIMVAFSLGYGWVLFVSAFFIFLEYIFIKFQLYEQYWWRYYMTAFVVFTYLPICHKWFNKLVKNCSGFIRYFTLYFSALVIAHIPAPILLLSGKQYYQLSYINNFAGNLYKSSIIIAFSYSLIEAFILVLFTCILKKWYWKIIPLFVSPIANGIFAKMNILIIKDGWDLFYTLIIYEIFIIAFILIEKYTLKTGFHKQH
ncbi:hypothetical protein OXPF_27400 [Oxobacter pfennigii]|uniref:Uncharacterized protein n=1 Tax=Oxobacter pfennigii TaxID=36849 RepID=A0A0P8WLJ7_9CLOT|nr:hypothetical protein [Oxobacter pfennigii]KPU43299.1 hypothetical protein OXPF_27400 [Oxobacter pfennigii]